MSVSVEITGVAGTAWFEGPMAHRLILGSTKRLVVNGRLEKEKSLIGTTTKENVRLPGETTMTTSTENRGIMLADVCRGIMLADVCKGIMLADVCKGIMLADVCKGIMLADVCKGIMLAD
jgi:hypothetical protein